MKTLALYGFATNTRDAVKNTQASEIWSLAWAYKYDVPRIDRLFEMHPVWLFQETDLLEYGKMRDHWSWLQENVTIPVYMLGQLPVIPRSINYPIDEVTEYLFHGLLKRGLDPSDFYSSSFDYMMGLAIFERWERIELYGFEMGSLTEYRYQREGAAFFIGQAIARGIEVVLQPQSVLLRGKRYGYQGGQMIFRQDLERLAAKFSEQRNNTVARLQHAEGRAATGDEAAAEEAAKLREQALIASGAEQAIQYCIREIDLEEPEIDLINPLVTLPLVAGNNGKE